MTESSASVKHTFPLLHFVNQCGKLYKYWIHATVGGMKMARKCVITGRRTRTGNKRSHALNASKRKWKANVQKVRIMVDGKPKRVYVSARALKSGKVKRV